MLHAALTAGVPWCDVGGMTLTDIALAAQVKQEKDKEFAQMMAWIIYNGAALTGVAVNDPKKFPKLEDAFPSLFEREEEVQQDWRVMKERMMGFARARKANHV